VDDDDDDECSIPFVEFRPVCPGWLEDIEGASRLLLLQIRPGEGRSERDSTRLLLLPLDNFDGELRVKNVYVDGISTDLLLDSSSPRRVSTSLPAILLTTLSSSTRVFFRIFIVLASLSNPSFFHFHCCRRAEGEDALMIISFN
jgi:hypothetical protein